MPSTREGARMRLPRASRFLAPLAVAALAAPRAHADAGLYLTWSECAISSVSTSNFDFVCFESGFEELYCAFTLPQATGADVLGLVAVIDLQHSAAALPDWWQLAKTGGCRSGDLPASADFTRNSES